MKEKTIEALQELFCDMADTGTQGCDGTTLEDFKTCLSSALSTAKEIQDILNQLEP